MTIDGQSRHAERVTEDDIRGFAAYAGQVHELVHRLRDLPAVPLDARVRHADERSRFRAKETRGLDLRLELLCRRLRERGGVRIAFEEGRGDLIHPLVVTLRG